MKNLFFFLFENTDIEQQLQQKQQEIGNTFKKHYVLTRGYKFLTQYSMQN